MSKEKNKPNWKKIITSILILSFLFYFLATSLSGWILNLVRSLLALWELVNLLEMPHKFYGLTIFLFISWKILEAVINLWIKGFEYAINLLKIKDSPKEKNE